MTHLDTHLVAVYGSLKSGFHNHSLLSTSKLVGKGRTVNRFTMYSLGSFPAITHNPVANIEVEVYSVSDKVFTRLDMLEGHPSFYKREEVYVVLEGSTILYVWIYFISNEDDFINRIPCDVSEDDRGFFFNWDNKKVI